MAKRGPDSRFVVKANIKALVPRSNSRRSKKLLVRGQSIRPKSQYWITFWQILNKIESFLNYYWKRFYSIHVFLTKMNKEIPHFRSAVLNRGTAVPLGHRAKAQGAPQRLNKYKKHTSSKRLKKINLNVFTFQKSLRKGSSKWVGFTSRRRQYNNL